MLRFDTIGEKVHGAVSSQAERIPLPRSLLPTFASALRAAFVPDTVRQFGRARTIDAVRERMV